MHANKAIFQDWTIEKIELNLIELLSAYIRSSRWSHNSGLLSCIIMSHRQYYVTTLCTWQVWWRYKCPNFTTSSIKMIIIFLQVQISVLSWRIFGTVFGKFYIEWTRILLFRIEILIIPYILRRSLSTSSFKSHI